ncbi:ATP-dependent helicase-like protein [Purpureocillium lilacinum]|uniref:ATP-dependent helicase-like protein n=1 Tax=Purpureocillium lilacinum TaxID=33203 RepID=A0A179HL95_PURLI|nr:ATP-dependent helicase-like protein [Purpureocillium lilacinum]OAQ91185.1 ATP-dependent helicase-like protein [Purpureocillium lilacinum]
MKSMKGLLHTTSLQEAQERQQASYGPAPLAGQKRSWSNNDGDPNERAHVSNGLVQFQRAVSLPAAPTRLSASSIVSARSQTDTSDYSQRRLLAATPTSSRDPELDLAHRTYDLPSQLVRNLASLVLLLKRVLGEPGCKALLVLPYVALVQEKVRWLRSVVRDLRLPECPSYDEAKGPWRRRADEGAIRVVGFFGGGKVRATWDDFDIGVCTLEKARQLPSTGVTPANSLQANALVNQAIDDCSIPKLRAVVLDELHMIDDDHRGYLLELIATKLLSIEQPIQIVGMSATLPVDLDQVLDLMRAEIPEVSSCLNTENRRIQRALLEVVSTRLATNHESICDYFSKSLLSHSHGVEFVHECLEKSLIEVQSMGLATGDTADGLVPTQLGRAIVASAIDPDDGVFVHRELTRALRAFVMDGEMHILYVFTPVQDFGVIVNWQVFRNEMEALDESGLRVMNFLGIKPTSILKLAQGATLKENTSEEKELARVYRRFYLALQLRDLCNETPIHVVSRKYDAPRGTVQTLSQTCQGFAAGMIKFCDTMGWGVMAAALEHFSDRLMAGARADLLALAKIPFIKSRTARVFWESGYRSVASIANADPKELLPVLMQAQPNKIRLKGRNDEKLEEKLLAKAEIITTAANRLWQIQLQAEMEEE